MPYRIFDTKQIEFTKYMFDSSSNSFGSLFRFMTFGESHGPYIGVVIDGVKPGIEIDVDDIQFELNRRKPGQSKVTTPRQEPDKAEIISGIFDGKTTGSPLCILIRNHDTRSQDYASIAKILRPGHASYTYLKKYGVFDYRGGGRASGRETALRVAAGAIAKKILTDRGIEVIGFSRQIGHVKSTISTDELDRNIIEGNIVRAPDTVSATKMIDTINEAKSKGDSIGGIVEVVVKNCQEGLGEPIYHKLDADLVAALMTIGAVKGAEIGDGFKYASSTGSASNDPYGKRQDGSFYTKTNKSGGILGGISNGEDIVVRIAVKPPSSITKPISTVDSTGEDISFSVKGRHDPCICPRVVPVAEAMVSLVLIDHILLQDRLHSIESKHAFKERIQLIDTHIQLLEMQKKEYEKKLDT